MDVLGLLAIPTLVLINAFFVGVEFALVAVRKTRVEEMVKQQVRGAKAVEKAVANIDTSIAAAQLGITLASIALGAVGEVVLARLMEPWFTFLPDGLGFLTRHSLATTLAVLIITFVHVILGEQVPKMAALQSSDRVALWTARPLNLFAKISYPILRMMNGTGNILLKSLGYEAGTGHASVHSVEELGMIVKSTHEAGLLDSHQAIFVQNVFKLSDKCVIDCMIPREKMDAIEVSTPPQKILEIVRNSGHTRLPVYEKDIDNIVGVLNSKNLFYFLTLQNAVVLEDALYPATFLAPDESIAIAMQLFRKTRRPMAMVRDANDKILGLITLEDVLEEIVGDLEDEQDGPISRRPRTKR